MLEAVHLLRAYGLHHGLNKKMEQLLGALRFFFFFFYSGLEKEWSNCVGRHVA